MGFREWLKKSGKKLVHKYRLTIDTEHTLEYRLSFRISRLDVFVFASLFSIVMIVFTMVTLKYTSLKEYITGHDQVRMNAQIVNAGIKIDSIDRIFDAHKKYEQNIRNIFDDNIDFKMLDKYETIPKNNALTKKNKFEHIPPSKEEKKLREEIDTEDKFNIDTGIDSYQLLFSPLKGSVVKKFDYDQRRFGVHIYVDKNEPVKSIADGTVIFSAWTVNEGQMIILSHNNGNLISVYKNTENTTKRQGDFVKSGEVIGFAGQTDTPLQRCLHFEIWINNHPIDPTSLISFRRT